MKLDQFLLFLLLFATGGEASSRRRVKRSSQSGFKSSYLFKKALWTKSQLTYSLHGRVESKNQTKFDTVRRVLEEAFQEWEKNSCFLFKDLTDDTSLKYLTDIKIIFTNDRLTSKDLILADGTHSQSHLRKCERLFKATGNAAHAFFRNHKLFPAQIHVNNEFFWMESHKMPGNISLKTLLLHEIGHVLGLMHSKDHEAVMHEFIYTNSVKQISLTDRISLNKLYKRFC